MAFWLAPGRSWSVFRFLEGGGTEYDVIGPMPDGSVLVSVWAHIDFLAVGSLQTALSLGASSQASAEALEAGRPLISVSNQWLNNEPQIVATSLVDATGVRHWKIPVGVQVQGGSKFVVVRSVAVDHTQVVYGFEVESVQKLEGPG